MSKPFEIMSFVDTNIIVKYTQRRKYYSKNLRKYVTKKQVAEMLKSKSLVYSYPGYEDITDKLKAELL